MPKLLFRAKDGILSKRYLASKTWADSILHQLKKEKRGE